MTRGWDSKAIMKTTSVVDTVATDALASAGGQTYVPVGGIAHAGDRGISKVEVQVDGGPWEPAELRRRSRGYLGHLAVRVAVAARASTPSPCAPTTARGCCRIRSHGSVPCRCDRHRQHGGASYVAPPGRSGFRSHGVPDKLSSGAKLLPASPNEGV